MNHASKVQTQHLDRCAYLYVRQSSMRQVLENTESSKRQYALRGRATALGWPDDRIIVVDSDQGESGASAVWREGFQHLVAQVGLGKAGIVMGLEVSRLARNNADWHRLLEICALSDTLILDEDGVYDPADFNDRLLLGLKGTMSEAELHVLKARLRGGIVNKARRGEYRCPLPIGLVYDPAGDVVLDPDAQVRETIHHFFETFARAGSAHRTVRVFREEGVQFPVRLRVRGGPTKVGFEALTLSAAQRVLHNPRYAGTYAYGRREYRRNVEGKRIVKARDPSAWTACIPDAHPGYISWEQYKENLRTLSNNAVAYDAARQPPREGPALLQGRGVCGRCGSRLRVKYQARRGRNEAWYLCWRAAADRGSPACQSIAGPPIDEAVGALVGEIVTPAAIDLAIEVRKELQDRVQEADRLRARNVQRAEQEAELARRRFMMVDPGNRLVADSLEAEWNERLRTLAAARDKFERQRDASNSGLDEGSLDRLSSLATDFKRMWSDPKTPARERKRMLAHIVEDVTLVKLPAEGITKIHVRFTGGRTETLTAANPKSFAEKMQTAPEVVAAIDEMLDAHIHEQIAEILNARGLRPGGAARPGQSGRQFCTKTVGYVVHAYQIRSRYDRLRERGMLTMKEMTERLSVSECTVARWAKHGLLVRHAYNGKNFLYEDPGPNPPKSEPSRWNTIEKRAARRRQQNDGVPR